MAPERDPQPLAPPNPPRRRGLFLAGLLVAIPVGTLVWWYKHHSFSYCLSPTPRLSAYAPLSVGLGLLLMLLRPRRSEPRHDRPSPLIAAAAAFYLLLPAVLVMIYDLLSYTPTSFHSRPSLTAIPLFGLMASLPAAALAFLMIAPLRARRLPTRHLLPLLVHPWWLLGMQRSGFLGISSIDEISYRIGVPRDWGFTLAPFGFDVSIPPLRLFYLMYLHSLAPIALVLLLLLLAERRPSLRPAHRTLITNGALLALACAWAVSSWPGFLLAVFVPALLLEAWAPLLLTPVILMIDPMRCSSDVMGIFLAAEYTAEDIAGMHGGLVRSEGLHADAILAGLLVLLAARGLIQCLLRLRRMRAEPLPASVSVLIPTWEEAGRIGPLVRRVRAMEEVSEVIVVDAASGDGTAEAARRAGASVLPYDPAEGGGRGGQIRAGVQRALGDVVAVLHADTNPADGLFADMLRALRTHPDAVGGAAGMLLWGGRRSPRLRWVEIANDARAAFLRISFGDQIQFARTRCARERDLWPAEPLMEDVAFSLRARRTGRLLYLWSRSESQPRSAEIGTLRRSWLVLGLHARYLLPRLLGRKPDPASMYARYYGPRP